MPATYEPIATTTTSGSATSITFSSISGSYTDLVLVVNLAGTVSPVNGLVRFNSDTGSNYSDTRLYGEGTNAVSDRLTNKTSANYLVSDYATHIFSIQNYSNTTTYKTMILKYADPANYVGATVSLWRSTAAINAVALSGFTFPNGSTATLYGIKAA